MKDILERLQRALPHIRSWITELHERHASSSVPVSARGFRRLPLCFRSWLLDTTSVAIVVAIPFPPVVEFGLPEFSEMAGMDMAGITFDDMYFVRQDCDVEAIHCHELVHVIQWRVLGVDDFLLTYATGILERGYRNSPLEAIAFDAGGLFENDDLRSSGLLDVVTEHALDARQSARETFAGHGLTMSAS